MNLVMLAGIVEAVEAPTAQNNMFQYTKLQKVLGEGNFVLTISEGQWNGTTNAFYDLFRMEDGMIVEDWDVIQPVPTGGACQRQRDVHRLRQLTVARSAAKTDRAIWLPGASTKHVGPSLACDMAAIREWQLNGQTLF